ncbi:low molecular weight protein arginine phosphatase [Paenibacillus chitinolyticus]|uniref:low molecular weight protein arginine phosphatase n=1 Tax=Paenibacillus chitinolyticus TaxID=79263 RepID=UPI0036511BC4
MKQILFVCTGNTCRSPLAEGILRHMAQQDNLEVHIRSAGVFASDGSPISRQSSSVLREKGCEASISSSLLRSADVDWADLILTMTQDHKRAVIQRFPQAADKTHTLKEFVEDDPAVVSAAEEWERLIAEVQVKHALSEEITVEERTRLIHLEKKLPNYDISDPFGGSLELYRHTAEEIEEALVKLVQKIKESQ